LNGVEVKGKSMLPWAISSYRLNIGDQVTILYNPQHPEKSFVHGSPWAIYGIPVIPFLFLTILFLLSIMAQLKFFQIPL
jgi:hypothetical protein